LIIARRISLLGLFEVVSGGYIFNIEGLLGFRKARLVSFPVSKNSDRATR
jgi:hypothetical protein